MASKNSHIEDLAKTMSTLFGAPVRVIGSPGKPAPRKVFSQAATAMVKALREELKFCPLRRAACIDIIVTGAERRLQLRSGRGKKGPAKYRIDCGRGDRVDPITTDTVATMLALENNEDAVLEIVDAVVNEFESGIELDAFALNHLANLNTDFARSCELQRFWDWQRRKKRRASP